MTKISEIIEPKTELEAFRHWQNRWQAELISMLSSSKKIEVTFL